MMLCGIEKGVDGRYGMERDEMGGILIFIFLFRFRRLQLFEKKKIQPLYVHVQHLHQP